MSVMTYLIPGRFPPHGLRRRARILGPVTAILTLAATLLLAGPGQEAAQASTAPSTPRVNKFVVTGPTTVDVQPYARCWTGGVNCWGSPDGDAPDSLTVYVVEEPTQSCTVASSLSWCTITGLSANRVYTFVATATNTWGASPASGPSAELTMPTARYNVETEPRGVAITGNGAIAVVANFNSDTVSRIALGAGTVSSIPVGDGPDSVALYGDYAYVTNSLANSLTRVDLNDATTTTISVCGAPQGIVVSPDDTTAYVACSGSNQIQPVSLNTFTAGTAVNIPGGAGYLAIDPAGTAVFTWKAFGSGTATLSRLRLSDDSITHTASVQRDAVGLAADATHVLTLNSTGLLTKFLASDLTSVSSFDVGPQEFTALAGSPTGTEVYAIARNTHLFHAVDTASMAVTRTYLIGDCTHPAQAAVDPTNSYILVSSACGAPGRAWRYSLSPAATGPTISSVTPATGPETGGTTVTIAGSGFTGATAVTFGGAAATFVVDSATQITATTTAGAPGAANVVVTTGTGSTVAIGAFTYVGGSPDPWTPAEPASQPLDVTAQPDNASVTVTWRAPASAGSFAITNYLVTASPGGRSCLTATLSCTVTELRNGTAYTFTVKALTGAGWSPASALSNAVVPSRPQRPSMTIAGSREGDRIVIRGESTGLGMGAIVTVWIDAGRGFREMRRTALVGMDGSFAWAKRLKRDVPVRVYASLGENVSNTIRLPR